MIVELLFSLIFGLVDMILSLVPTVDLNFQMPDTTFFREMLGLADYFFPVGTMIACIALIIAVQNIAFILKIVNYIWNKIPFI